MRSLLALFAALSLSTSALAQFSGAPDLITFQGVLADSNGVAVADGSYNLLFSLYRDSVGGSSIWSETHNAGNAIQTNNGVFDAVLGSISSLAGIAFDTSLFLAVAINGGADLSPRTRLSSTPYALGLRNLRVIPETTSEGPNMIGGWSGNTVPDSVVGATIAGGGDPDVSGSPRPNSVVDDYGTISGGSDNAATGRFGTVGGGALNTAAGLYSMVPGGNLNYAGGNYSFAAGIGAKVRDADHGTFVWSEAQPSIFESTGENQFLIKASGGVGMGTNSPLNNSQLHVEHGPMGTDDWGVVISNSSATNNRGGIRVGDSGFLEITNKANDSSPDFARLTSTGNWSAVSDRRIKSEIEPAVGLLDIAMQLEPVSYRLKSQESMAQRSLGLIAQDVQRVIPSLVTEGDVLTLNYAGVGVVALGAVHELHSTQTDQERRIAELESTVESQNRRLAELEGLVASLADQLHAAEL